MVANTRRKALSAAERRELEAAAAAEAEELGLAAAPPETLPAPAAGGGLGTRGNLPSLDKPRRTTVIIRPHVRRMMEYAAIEHRVTLSQFIEMSVLHFLKEDGVQDPREVPGGTPS